MGLTLGLETEHAGHLALLIRCLLITVRTDAWLIATLYLTTMLTLWCGNVCTTVQVGSMLTIELRLAFRCVRRSGLCLGRGTTLPVYLCVQLDNLQMLITTENVTLLVRIVGLLIISHLHVCRTVGR